jgi:5-methyltetrahydrofolate corrinoid/iron sulfur protein methyltransferase
MTKHASTNPSLTNLPTSPSRPFKLIGELMNNSFARAARAFANRNIVAYQRLARLQTTLGADYLTLNIDGTRSLRVRPAEMLAFLPDLIPAIQEATRVPLAFDNPSIDYHRCCLQAYDREKGGRPIVNSVAASRERLDELLELVAEYDTLVVGMASERRVDGESAQCLSAADVYNAARWLVDLLVDRANRSPDQIIIDPGLAPVGADTYGLVNMSLDAMRRIRNDATLDGIHLSVGLTNFSFGVPKYIREGIESAYLTLAVESGLDFVLANPEKELTLLAPDNTYYQIVVQALECGRPIAGETQEDAGFRQAERILELF